MIEQVAVQRPIAWIVGVEGHGHAAIRGDQDGVAHRAGEAIAVDVDHLKLVPVQMHRMGHRRLVDEHELDPLALRDGQGRNVLVPDDIVDRPYVSSHFAGQVERVDTVSLPLRKRLCGAQTPLEIERQRRRSGRRQVGNTGDCPLAGDEHDSGLPALTFELSKHRIGAGAGRD